MKKFFIGILMVVIVTTFSSCMMMMPGHMTGAMQGSHNHGLSTEKIDPVCGKQVGEVSVFTYEYQGNRYYFDSEQCLSVFKNNPDHFLHESDKATHMKPWVKVGIIGGGVVMTAMMVLMLTRGF
ncbi:MAG: YHS domain-containing protein [Bacteroidetes bacterium]|nr:YHS domain-containing protein [Bacteroidota bacterium]